MRSALAHNKHTLLLTVLVHGFVGEEAGDRHPAVEVRVAVAVELVYNAKVRLQGPQLFQLLLQRL